MPTRGEKLQQQFKGTIQIVREELATYREAVAQMEAAGEAVPRSLIDQADSLVARLEAQHKRVLAIRKREKKALKNLLDSVERAVRGFVEMGDERDEDFKEAEREIRQQAMHAVECFTHDDLFQSRQVAIASCYRFIKAAYTTAETWGEFVEWSANPFARVFPYIRALYDVEEVPVPHDLYPAHPEGDRDWYVWIQEEGPDGKVVKEFDASQEEFEEANIDDPDLIAAIRAMVTGETRIFGGGAEPVTRIERGDDKVEDPVVERDAQYRYVMRYQSSVPEEILPRDTDVDTLTGVVELSKLLAKYAPEAGSNYYDKVAFQAWPKGQMRPKSPTEGGFRFDLTQADVKAIDPFNPRDGFSAAGIVGVGELAAPMTIYDQDLIANVDKAMRTEAAEPGKGSVTEEQKALLTAMGTWEAKAQRPGRAFRAPHHTVSKGGLLDELAQAQGGVLYLDELEDFPPGTIDALASAMRDADYGFTVITPPRPQARDRGVTDYAALMNLNEAGALRYLRDVFDRNLSLLKWGVTGREFPGTAPVKRPEPTTPPKAVKTPKTEAKSTVKIIDINTGDETIEFFAMPPREALIAAVEQARGNYNTWDYPEDLPGIKEQTLSSGHLRLGWWNDKTEKMFYAYEDLAAAPWRGDAPPKAVKTPRAKAKPPTPVPAAPTTLSDEEKDAKLMAAFQAAITAAIREA